MRGRLGLTWTLFSLCPARASAHLLTTRKRAAVLPAAVVRSIRGARRMRIQLHGLVAGTPIFFCQASLALPLSGVLMGVAPARFPFAGQYSVRETNAQPAPATGLFKGFGTLSQQAKTDFRRTRRKSALSICGNKCTACYGCTEFGTIVVSSVTIHSFCMSSKSKQEASNGTTNHQSHKSVPLFNPDNRIHTPSTTSTNRATSLP